MAYFKIGAARHADLPIVAAPPRDGSTGRKHHTSAVGQRIGAGHGVGRQGGEPRFEPPIGTEGH
nr:hypothetical protein [uncultured Prevotella sp.]